jgi:hypothetical protein
MPEKCRLNVCGFDPMLVRGYVSTGFRALWVYVPDEMYEDYKIKPGDKVRGKILAVYNGDGEQTWNTVRPIEWEASRETGYALNIPPADIVRYELTEFHFVEVVFEEIVRKTGEVEPIYPGEEKVRKWWPDEKMKLKFKLAYAAPEAHVVEQLVGMEEPQETE